MYYGDKNSMYMYVFTIQIMRGCQLFFSDYLQLLILEKFL